MNQIKINEIIVDTLNYYEFHHIPLRKELTLYEVFTVLEMQVPEYGNVRKQMFVLFKKTYTDLKRDNK